MSSAASPAPVTVGQPAPDFTLSSTSGDKVTLSALRGRTVLLAFFPLAFTSTCTAELCEMRDDYAQFEAENVTILPISVDSVPTLKEYRRMHDLGVDLLSDFRREASRSYGVLLQEQFFSARAYFLIDAEGILRWRHVEEVLGHRRSDEELLAQIRALQAVPRA